MLDKDVHVPLGLDEHLFFVPGIVEPQFVEPLTALGGARFESADVGIMRVFFVRAVAQVMRHLIEVVDAPHHERPVGVAFQEGHHNLLPDAGPEDGPPAFARPWLGDPHQTTRVLMPPVGRLVPLSVPVKFDADPAVLVDPDFLVLLAINHAGLQSLHDRLGCLAGRAIGPEPRDARETVAVGTAVLVDVRIIACPELGSLQDVVLDGRQQIAPVGRLVGVLNQFEMVPHSKRRFA